MSIKSEVHEIQKSILRVLLYTPEATFSALNVDKVPSDQFTFHLKTLVDTGHVEKTTENRYRLTPQGKEFTNRFDADTRNVVLERQAKLGALVACARTVGGKTQYLMQQRLKQPYYGFHGFITGKLKWGETPAEGAARELKEEAGVTAQLTFIGIEHKMDYDTAGNILEDKYFFLFKGKKVEGELVECFEGGANLWVAESDIPRLPDLYEDVPEVLRAFAEEKLVFLEKKFSVRKY